jgi:hypothetical protein
MEGRERAARRQVVLQRGFEARTVPTGVTTQTCSGVAGAVTGSTQLTVTAAYNNSSQTAVVTVVPQQ